MPILEKLRNIFAGSGDGKKKVRHYQYIKRDVDPAELWDLVGELGDGAFGKVYKATQKDGAVEAALKQVDITDESELEEYSVEIDILSQCRHKNIVGIYEAYYFNSKLCMYIEFCGGGAVDGIMEELEKPLTEPQIRCICHEMCEALDFLHQHFVIHRDLKAGNVLLTNDGQVRLADFGVSAKNASARQRRDSFIGTPYWMAPEVIMCETIKDSPYNFKADIWSFGITLIEFAEVNPPNHEMHPMRVFIKIQKSSPPKLSQPNIWSAEFSDFLSMCLVKDPDQRSSASDLREHSFIRDVIDMHPLIELVSEANAEVVYEEKDIEEVDSDTESVVDTDLDTVSLSSAVTSESARFDIGSTAGRQPSPTAETSLKMGNELGHSDVIVQPLTTDEHGEVKVTAAGPSSVEEVSNDVSEPASQSVDNVNLPCEMLPSAICDVEARAVCDEDEVMQTEVESGHDESVAAAEEQEASKLDDDVDGGPCQRLDETVTSFINEKLDSEDATVVREDSIMDVGPVNADLSETAQNHSIDPSLTGGSDLPVKGDRLEPAVVVETSSSSDIDVDKPVDNAAEVVSECKESTDGSGDLHDVSVLSDDTDRVNTEVENVTAQPESCVSGLVEDNIPVQPGCTAAQSDDIIATSDTDAVSGSAGVSLQPHQSLVTPELAEAEKPEDGVLERQLKDVDEFVEAGRGTGGGDSVHADEDTPLVNADAETAAQFEHVDGSVESVCSEAEDADVVSDTHDGLPVAESDSRQPTSIGGDDEMSAEVEHVAVDIAHPASKEDEDADVVLHTGDVVPVSKSDGRQSNSVSTDAETAANSHVEITQPASDEVVCADVVISSTGDGEPVAESPSQQSTSVDVDAETAALSEHIGIDTAQPACDEAIYVDVVSFTGDGEPVVESPSRQSTSDVIDPEAAALPEDIGIDTAQPACDEAPAAKIVSPAGDNLAVIDSDNLPSISVVKPLDDVEDTLQDSVAGQEGSTNAEAGGGDMSDAGDWLDNVVDVSNISFVSKGEVCVNDVSREEETDAVAVADVVDGSSDDVAAMETSLETVAAVNTDSVKDQSDIGKASCTQENAENGVAVAEKMDTVDGGKPSIRDINSQQVDTDVGGKAEKSRLYSKNVVKSDTPAAGPAACLATDVKVASKAGTPSQQGVKVTENQPSESQPVVMRRKLPPQIDSAGDKENEASKIQKGKSTRKTLTKTRKFVVNGVVMTSQTSRVVADEMKKQHEHQLWKADLRELKRLHVQENRLMQAHASKALAAKEEQIKKFELDKQTMLRTHDSELDQLMRQNRQSQEKLSAAQVAECKALQKKLKSEQERDLKTFHDGLKQDMKLLKQSIDMLPKDMRKDMLRQRKEEKDAEQAEKERQFLEQQATAMEDAMKRLLEQHREKVALYEKQYLQQKHQLQREHETAVVELERRQVLEKKQLEEKQLKEKFILQRQLLMTRQAKELDQIKHIAAQKEEDMVQCHLLERKRLPKILKSDTKTRTMMYRESLRITGGEFTMEMERERMKQFDEAEKVRMKQETMRLEKKQTRQMTELKAKNEAIIKELDQVYLEKQTALLENEKQKMEDLENAHQQAMDSWTEKIGPRQQAMEEEFTLEFVKFEKFYSSSDADCPPYPTGNTASTDNTSKLSAAARSSTAV